MHLKDTHIPTFGTCERDLIWKPDPCRCSLGWGHWSRLYYNKPSWGWGFWTPKMDTDMHTRECHMNTKAIRASQNMPTVASRWSQMVTPGSPTSSSKKTQTYFWILSPAVLGNKRSFYLPPCLWALRLFLPLLITSCTTSSWSLLLIPPHCPAAALSPAREPLTHREALCADKPTNCRMDVSFPGAHTPSKYNVAEDRHHRENGALEAKRPAVIQGLTTGQGTNWTWSGLNQFSSTS